jgi:uncharacterized OB-fold protein
VQAKRPIPMPTPETKPYWDGLKRHELWLPYSRSAGQFFFYPRAYSPIPGSDPTDIEWRRCSGRATVHTFVINHRPAPGFEGPYVIAVVQLEEGPRMMTNLIGVEPDPAKIKVDMPLEIVYEDISDEITIPLFRPAGS